MARASPPTEQSFRARCPASGRCVRHEGKRAELIETLSAAPDRAKPICPWYGRCGGCAAQHMSVRLYRQWKRGLVVEALKREGVAAEVGELVDAHGAGRRRATFHARFPHGQADEVGFMRVRSHDIIAIDDCPLFSPGMAGAIAAARALSGDLRGLMKPIDIGVTATLDGLDVDLRGSGALERAEAQKLARTADALDLARNDIVEPQSTGGAPTDLVHGITVMRHDVRLRSGGRYSAS